MRTTARSPRLPDAGTDTPVPSCSRMGTQIDGPLPQLLNVSDVCRALLVWVRQSAVDPSRLHYFDPETGLRLEANRVPAAVAAQT